MVYQIFKKEDDGWILIVEYPNFSDSLVCIKNLQIDGNEYRMEERNGHISTVLDI